MDEDQGPWGEDAFGLGTLIQGLAAAAEQEVTASGPALDAACRLAEEMCQEALAANEVERLEQALKEPAE